MERDNRGNAGAQRDHPGKPSSTPYSHPPPQERRRSTRATRSRSTPQNLARPDVLVTPDPLAQPTPPPSPTSNPPAHQRIPQLPYVSTRTRDFIPTEPVPFSVNGAPGISVSQAIAGEYEGLAGRDDRISSFKSSKAICRIRFPGHDPYKFNVNTHSSRWEPIMRSKLAKEIGRSVKAYVEKQGLQGAFDLNKVYLTCLTHVSKGSWQPELWYEGSIPQNFGA